jgi:hypothetical protein
MGVAGHEGIDDLATLGGGATGRDEIVVVKPDAVGLEAAVVPDGASRTAAITFSVSVGCTLREPAHRAHSDGAFVLFSHECM